MATIGTFTRDKTGYAGAIRTLTVDIKARFVLNDARKSESAPDFRIFSGQAELGAAWKARSSGETPRDCLSVVLDDPCFADRRAWRVERRTAGAGVRGREDRETGLRARTLRDRRPSRPACDRRPRRAGLSLWAAPSACSKGRIAVARERLYGRDARNGRAVRLADRRWARSSADRRSRAC